MKYSSFNIKLNPTQRRELMRQLIREDVEQSGSALDVLLDLHSEATRADESRDGQPILWLDSLEHLLQNEIGMKPR